MGSRKSIGISSLACYEMWVKMRPEQGKLFGEDSQITGNSHREARAAPLSQPTRFRRSVAGASESTASICLLRVPAIRT
jgi:hypothetical protein